MAMLNDSFLLNLPTVNKMDQLAAPKQRWLSVIKKNVSPVGIGMGISQLLLDVCSKTNNFLNASFILGRN